MKSIHQSYGWMTFLRGLELESWKMKIRLIAVGLLFSIIFAPSATALFGSECRKPKSLFTEQLALSKKLKKEGYYISPKNQAAYDQKRKNKKLLDLPPEPPWDTLKLLKAEKALDTAYRIVLNNKKCFDPLIVVDAQRFFGK